MVAVNSVTSSDEPPVAAFRSASADSDASFPSSPGFRGGMRGGRPKMSASRARASDAGCESAPTEFDLPEILSRMLTPICPYDFRITFYAIARKVRARPSDQHGSHAGICPVAGDDLKCNARPYVPNAMQLALARSGRFDHIRSEHMNRGERSCIFILCYGALPSLPSGPHCFQIGR